MHAFGIGERVKAITGQAMPVRSTHYRSLAGALVLILFSSPGLGQSSASAARIADLSAQLDSAVAAKADAINMLNYITENATPVKKELKLWDEQILVLQKEIELRDAKWKNYDADVAAVNEKVHAHNAVCSGSLPKPQYDRCKGEEPYLQSQIDRVNATKAQLDNESNALKKRGEPIIARHRELSSKMDKFRADFVQAETTLNDAQARIQTLTARLRAESNKNTTREAAVHCGQVNWDGAARNLAPPPADPVWNPPAGPAKAGPLAPAR